MGELKAIRGGKAKELAKARILECACGSRTMIEVRVGVALSRHGKVIHRGTPMHKCATCGKLVE